MLHAVPLEDVHTCSNSFEKIHQVKLKLYLVT